MAKITIKELHAKTGEAVRKAGKSRQPIAVTNRGKLVAVLAPLHLYTGKTRRRTLLPEYKKLLAKSGAANVLDDLDAMRGYR
jgi:prevent-host-death family protein